MNKTGSNAAPLIIIAILMAAGLVGLVIVGGVAFFLFVSSSGGKPPGPTPVTAQTFPARPPPSAVPAAQPYYEVAMIYPGASPDELDRGWRGWLPDALQSEVVRTVSEQGKLRLYLLTALPLKELEESISASQRLPADVAETQGWLSVTALPNGLPPKPVVATIPQLVVKIDHGRAAALGISATDIARALEGRTGADIETIGNTMLKTPTDVRVRLAEIVEIHSIAGPSHIIRDFP